MFSKHSQAKKLTRQIQSALTYDEWYAAARDLDVLKGHDAWIDDSRSQWFQHDAIRDKISQFETCRRLRQPLELMQALEEGLSQHLNDVIHPLLYCETYTGENKAIAREFLHAAANALLYLCDEEKEGYPDAVKLEIFRQADHKFGRSALLLSGGATMGIYHLGVVKALFDLDLLPKVITGSSMGAIVAASVCTRTPHELRDFFYEPTSIHRAAMKLKKPLTVLAERSLFEPAQLLEHIQANIGGDYTFAEAYKKTGLDLNISVSPTRSRQKPKILNHITSPDVLISHSTLASCSMPFLYQPSMLMARGSQGEPVPYLPDERWIDGSVGGDVPMARVSRLHNINHYIVSQTNPYVYVFVGKSDKPSLRHLSVEVVGSIVHAQACSLLNSARKLMHDNKVRPVLDQLYSLTAQPYMGDINIHPRVDLALLRKYVANPTMADLKRFILEGERVTWMKMAMIRDQTLISRTLAGIIDKLETRLGR